MASLPQLCRPGNSITSSPTSLFGRPKYRMSCTWLAATLMVIFVTIVLVFPPKSLRILTTPQDTINSFSATKKLVIPYPLPILLGIDTFISNSTGPLLLTAPLNSLAAAFSNRSKCSIRPMRSALLEALSETAANHREDEHVKLASSYDTLTVQVCKGRIDTSPLHTAVEDFTKYANGTYNTILLLPCPRSVNTTALLRTISIESNKSLRYPSVVVREAQPGDTAADGRAQAFHAASHLVVLSLDADGAMAALMATTTTGVFFPKSHPYLAVDAFRHSAPLRRSVDPRDVALSGLGPVRESCCQFESFGNGDGSKMVCTNALHATTSTIETEPNFDGCWILSVGCAGRWSFETDIVSRTNCIVHVFDCTGDFVVPSSLGETVVFHKLCIGSGMFNRTAGFRTYNELVSIATNGRNNPPALMKLDVEGFEFPVMKQIVQNINVPKQVVVEVHVITSFNVGKPFVKRLHIKGGSQTVDDADVREWISTLNDVGYELVHRADNPHCAHCSEITLLHNSTLPSVN